MTSNVKCTDHTAPAIMLINAMARQAKNSNTDLLSMFPTQPPLQTEYVTVELKINGTEVDFVKTAQEMWERLEARHDQHVLETAKQLVSGTRLEKLQGILDRVEWELEQEVERLFNIKKEVE